MSTISAEFLEKQKNEPLLRENPGRFVIFPINYGDVWEMYKLHEASFWTAEEIDLSQDMKDWHSLNSDEQHFIKNVLAFFAASDGIVLENLSQQFCSEIQIPEARSFYGFQMAMENIHSETYSLLIQQYISDRTERDHLFNAIRTIPSIKAKAEWAMKWMDPVKNCFAERLLGFAAVEGILFSGSFCSIFWLKSRGKMPGLTFSNELISRDEGLHTDFAVLLYSKLENKLPESHVHAMISEAVEVERGFITESLNCELVGINAGLMTEYIHSIADRLLDSLGYSKLYGAKNPFKFMDMISLQGKTNFFEKRVGEYQKSGVKIGEEDSKENMFSTDTDF